MRRAARARFNVNSVGTLSTGDIVVGDAGENTSTPAPASVGRVNVNSGGALESVGDIVVGNAGTATLALQSSGLVQTKGTIFVNKGGTGNPDSIQAADSAIETAGGITILGVGQVGLNRSTLTATAGDAFLVENHGDATISISNVNNTIKAGSGNLLKVIGPDAKAALTATGSTLTGNILADGSANVQLTNSSTFTGAINPDTTLTGPDGLNPAETIPASLPENVNLTVDGTSIWNMTESSTLGQLSVASGAKININFKEPSGSFRTLVVNSLTGSGATFGMNVNLPALRGDLLVVRNISQGSHLLVINDFSQSADPNTALLVVMTHDGQATFRSNLVDAGTFKDLLQRGNGSSLIPNENNWYLVRGDEIKQATP